MATIRVLVPEATRNYIENPSMRFTADGWTASGSTITRSTDESRFNIASLKVVTTGAALNEGAFYRVSELEGVTDIVTVSCYAKGQGRVRIRLDDNAPGGGESRGDAVYLDSVRWKRLSVTGRCYGGNDLRLVVETESNAAQSVTFYLDGAQMERFHEPTTYCDGDQPGCRWNIMQHASQSTRPESTREGGRWVCVGGLCRESDDIYVTVLGGLGMAPITNNIQPFAQQPGAFFQSSKVNSRVVTITFHTKHMDNFNNSAVLSHLHELRQQLIDIFKPDKTRGDQAWMIEYSEEGAVPVYLWVRYEAGLEGEWDIRNQWTNSFPIRFLAVSPYWVEDDQQVGTLDIQDTIPANYVFGRENLEWTNLNYGFDDQAADLAVGRSGEIYAVGVFSVVNNNAAAKDPLLAVDTIVYWDGEQWNSIGNPAANNLVTDIVVDYNGDLIVCGAFTSIDGVAAKRIARWDGTTWSQVGEGLSGQVNSIAVSPKGYIYAGGFFTADGSGTTSLYRIAYFDGFQWRRMGQYGGVDGSVGTIEVSADGETVYIGGSFEEEEGGAGLTLTRVAGYDVSEGTFFALGDGLDSVVSVLKLSGENILYAGGIFENSGSRECKGIGVFQGNVWNEVGGGATFSSSLVANVLDIDFFSNGMMLVVGRFLNVGGIDAPYIALWTGYNWTNVDGLIKAATFDTQYITKCAINRITDDLYLASNYQFNKLDSSGVVTIENIGSAEIKPNFYFKGPCTLRIIENRTTQKRIYFDLLIQENEEVFVNIGNGTVRSSVRGNLLYAVLPGSELRAFSLIPGDNEIACFVTDDVDAVGQIYYNPRHWSADAINRGEEL